MSDSCGEASPRVGVGNGEFDPLPSGNGAGNGESTAKDFYLFAYISHQKMITLVTLSMLSLHIIIHYHDLSISRYDTRFTLVIVAFDLVS